MVLNPRKWTKEYEKIRPTYVQFTEKLRVLLKELVERKRIPYYTIEPRTKTLKSFRDKIIRPAKHYNNPLREITDLSGIRIIVFYLDDVDRVARIIDNEFLISQANSMDKAETLKPHEFGYLANHYVISLSRNRNALPEWRDFKSLKAEIQIRTVLQHAWASIDQALRYKKEADVPYQFRRKLFRLSGILELADEEFTSLKTMIASLKSTIRDRIEKDDIDLEVNVDTLGGYMKSDIVQRLVKYAKDIKRAKVRIQRGTKRDLSKLVSYCSASGLHRVSQLDTLLKSIMSNVPTFYEHIAVAEDAEEEEVVDWFVTAPYLVIYLIIGLHPKVFSSRKQKQLLKTWNRSFLKRMLKYGKSDFSP